MQLGDQQSHSALVDELTELLARHRGAIDLCDEAASRIQDLRLRVFVHGLVTHHIREVDELSHVVSRLGAQPNREPRPSQCSRDEIRELDDDSRLVRAVLAKEEFLAEACRRVSDACRGHDEEVGLVRRLTLRPRRALSGLTRQLASLVAN